MKEIDDMIRRLRSRGIKVDKVKYPKHVLCEKEMDEKAKKHSEAELPGFQRLFVYMKKDCSVYSLISRNGY